MNLKRIFRVITVLFSLVILTEYSIKKSYAEEKMHIAVIDFVAKDVSQKDAEKISELIRNDIIKTGKFIVIERSQMQEILKEQQLQQTGCTDVSCAVQMGKLLSANKILVGTVMKVGNEIIISGRIVDVEKGIAELSGKSSAADENRIVPAVKKFVEELSSSVYPGNAETRPLYLKIFDPVLSKNTYFTGTIVFFSLSAASFGGGIYFDSKAMNYSDKYDDLAKIYKTSTDPDVILRTKNSMSKAEDDADRYAKYRNISLGMGAGFSLIGCYFLYLYLKFPPSETVSYQVEPDIIPVFYTNFADSRIRGSGYCISGGLSFRF